MDILSYEIGGNVWLCASFSENKLTSSFWIIRWWADPNNWRTRSCVWNFNPKPTSIASLQTLPRKQSWYFQYDLMTDKLIVTLRGEGGAGGPMDAEKAVPNLQTQVCQCPDLKMM